MQGYDPISENVVPDPGEQVLYESGLPLPTPKLADHLPPGGGESPIPHYQTFSMLVNSMARTYRWSFDEALRHSQENALAIRRDPVVMHSIRARQVPVTQLPWHLETEDDQDEVANAGIKLITAAVKAIPRLQQFLLHLDEAIYFGRYGVQMMQEWDFSEGKKQLRIRDHRPINGDKLVFRWSGEAGILVHSAYPGSWQVTDRGRAHFFTPEERQQVVIHKFEPEDADFYEGDLAGGINGVGIRSRVYWLWYLKQQVLSFLMDYLERVGAGGFTVYYYEMGNPASLAAVQQAAEAQWRNNAILFPRYMANTTAKGGPGVENIAVSTAGAQLLQSLITEYFDNIIRQYILGQSLTTQQSSGGGLGDGVAGLHEDSFARIIKYDAVNLQETLTQDLIKVLQRYNCPKVKKPIKWVFEVDKPNAKELLEAANAFFEMGGTVDEDEMRGVIGLSKPVPGGSILAKFQNLSPMAAGAAGQVPAGEPMVGAAGPPGTGGSVPSPQGDQAAGGPEQAPPVQMKRKGRPVKMAQVPQPPKINKPIPVTTHLAEMAPKFGGEMKGAAGDQLHIPIGTDRTIIVHPFKIYGPEKAYTVFGWNKTNKEGKSVVGGYSSHGDELQPGSLDLVRKVRDIWQHLGQKDVPVTYVAEGQRAKLYASILKKLGFKLEDNEDVKHGIYSWQPPQSPTQVKMAAHGTSVDIETPEMREAREAQEAYDQGSISLYNYLKAQLPGFRKSIGGKEYLNSFDRGPQVKESYPISGHQGSAIGQKSLYSPKMLDYYTKYLQEHPQGDTEPLVVTGGPEAYSMYDGHHRIEAYKKNKRTHIPVWKSVEETPTQTVNENRYYNG